ncbi:hypothetical protein ASPFODRAFT_556705 [Aspergillus luchuensis CBS 106.47]|uniref:Uncharacterized protein n=1 Tax=Aspergillus luchuensis (strain CBS 106.47) TaxID=1137211 RepID=A0A1M3SYQ7_ASPLC|nr:hypothetical protein ASPFODRAFT_556705 [Aspergillus luchuensis CBS 106.47]
MLLSRRVRTCRQPVASFAAVSACSFPSMPLCEGIHRKSMASLSWRAFSMATRMVSRIYCPDCRPGFCSARNAAWLSVKITTRCIWRRRMITMAILGADRCCSDSALYATSIRARLKTQNSLLVLAGALLWPEVNL